MVQEYASDQGEPAGSAGQPCLTVLQRQDLLNCVAVVVRYYGGTDLGIGGLVRAYAGAVGAAIEEAGVLERPPRDSVRFEVSYDDSGTVRSILESEPVSFVGSYEAGVEFRVTGTPADLRSVTDRILSATSGRATTRE